MSIDLEKIFQTFLQQQNLEEEKLLLMISGGVDSMVLLHVAAQVVAPELLSVFHLDHNTRVNSTNDSLFVQNVCSKNKIKFYGEKLTSSPEQNIEASWRGERKRLALKAAEDFDAATILTAHHATDLVETMIFRLTKGAGPNGLSPFDTTTKPFWETPKQALVDYAEIHKLEWKEDSTNLNTKFERNLIRLEILPVLKKITPNLEQVFVREAKTFSQLQNFVETQLQTHCSLEIEQKIISLEKFINLHPTLQAEFLRTIATKIPSQSELEDCLKWLLNNPKGNSEKIIGETNLQIKAGEIIW